MRNAEINRHRRHRPSLLTASQLTLPDPEADGGATAESEVIDLTFDAAVEEAFEHLSPDFREVIELVDIGGPHLRRGSRSRRSTRRYGDEPAPPSTPKGS